MSKLSGSGESGNRNAEQRLASPRLLERPPQTRPWTKKESTVTRAPEGCAAVLRGWIAVSPGADGYGFVEPERGGGQVLFRGSNVVSGSRLLAGESVQYALAGGSFSLEAVAVSPSNVQREREGHR